MFATMAANSEPFMGVTFSIFWYANCARLRGEVRHPSDGHHDYDAIRAGLAEGVVADIVGHEKPYNADQLPTVPNSFSIWS